MTASTDYTPTEAQIADVLRRTGSDPRRLAIAYLRATKRARDAGVAAGVMGDIADASLGLADGDGGKIMKSLRDAERKLRAYRKTTE
jgi:hypothetical protein